MLNIKEMLSSTTMNTLERRTGAEVNWLVQCIFFKYNLLFQDENLDDFDDEVH